MHIWIKQCKELIEKKTFSLMLQGISPRHIFHTNIKSWKDNLPFQNSSESWFRVLPWFMIDIRTLYLGFQKEGHIIRKIYRFRFYEVQRLSNVIKTWINDAYNTGDISSGDIKKYMSSPTISKQSRYQNILFLTTWTNNSQIIMTNY